MSLLSYTCQGISSQNRYTCFLWFLCFLLWMHIRMGRFCFQLTLVSTHVHTHPYHTPEGYSEALLQLWFTTSCVCDCLLFTSCQDFFLLLFSFFGLFSKVFSCKSVLLLVVSWSWICPMTWGQQMFTQIKSHSNKAQHDTKGSVTSANMSTFSY